MRWEEEKGEEEEERSTAGAGKAAGRAPALSLCSCATASPIPVPGQASVPEAEQIRVERARRRSHKGPAVGPSGAQVLGEKCHALPRFFLCRQARSQQGWLQPFSPGSASSILKRLFPGHIPASRDVQRLPCVTSPGLPATHWDNHEERLGWRAHRAGKGKGVCWETMGQQGENFVPVKQGASG